MKIIKRRFSLSIVSVLVLLVFALFVLLACNVFAQKTFTIEKIPKRDVVVAEFQSIPLEYELKIKNLLFVSDYYKFFSLLNVFVYPIEPILFESLEEKKIQLKIYLKENLVNKFPQKYAYTYYIKNSYEDYEDKFVFSLVKASDAFSIDVPSEISIQDKEIAIKIKNNLNADFDNLVFSAIHSDLIVSSENFSLSPLEEKEIKLKLNSEKLKTERAGKKSVKFVLAYDGIYGKKEENSFSFEREISITEYRNVVIDKKESLIFIGKKIEVKKTNKGNSPVEEKIEISVDPLEKIFVSTSEKAKVRKQGENYIYEFDFVLSPNESKTVRLSINYAWLIVPLVVILIVILIVYFSRKEGLVFKKEVKKVKTKSGLFALRVYLTIKNKRKSPLKEVALLDYLPLSLTYHEYGFTLPDKTEGNKLYWSLGELLPGEEKTISYVCVSKIKFEGTLTLPAAKLKYLDEKNRKIIVESNTASINITEEEE